MTVKFNLSRGLGFLKAKFQNSGQKMGLFRKPWKSDVRLEGKTAIITGCNTGIGKCNALDFYKRGCRVIMACRDVEKAERAKFDIMEAAGDKEDVGILVVEQLDLASLKSVREFAEKILKKESRIHILVNNAGVMAPKKAKTEDGFELQFGTNHLGHFFLTLLLLHKIIESAPARIINVSSVAHRFGRINFSDLNSEKSYSRFGAYAQSKLANILFTKELAQRLEGTRVNVYALHPGIVKTDIGRHLTDSAYPCYNKMCRKAMRCMFISVEEGTQTNLYCALDEKAGQESGLYYKNCRVATPSSRARNMESAKKLWEVSLKMAGFDFDPVQPRPH